MDKKDTNSYTEHSKQARANNANKTKKRKLNKGEYKQISFIVKSNVFNKIAEIKKEKKISYSGILENYIELMEK